jgi:hypothetical protein
MEKLKYFCLLGLVSLMLGFTGCKQLQPVVTTDSTKTRTITETVHDSIVFVKPDSAAIKAFFECDSLNQVVLRQLAVEKGRIIEPEVKWLPGGILEVTAKVDSQAVYLYWKERYIHDVDSTKVSKVVVVKEKPPWSSAKGKLKIILLLGFIISLFFILRNK